MHTTPAAPANIDRRQNSLTPDEVARLRLLAALSPAEIAALADVSAGVVTAGRLRRFTMILLATIGAAATAWLGVVHSLDWWRGQ